jgi:hypothetical protein
MSVPNLASPRIAFALRDLIRGMAREEIERRRPRYKYGIVQSIDRPNWQCDVLYAGDTDPVTVKMGNIQPAITGQIVRVEGLIGDKFITDVIGAPAAPFVKRLGEVFDTNAYTLPTAGANVTFAVSVCPVIVNFPVQHRVKCLFRSRYTLGTTTAGRIVGNIAWNLDTDTPDVTTASVADSFFTVYNGSGIATTSGSSGDSVFQTFLLPAGTHVVFGAVRRQNGGSATDTFSASSLLLEDYGPE